MKKINSSFEGWLFNFFAQSSQGLSLYRIFYILFLLGFIGLNTLTWLNQNPDYLYNPPPMSIANLFSEFPSPLLLQSVYFSSLIASIFVLFGFKARLFSLILAISLIVGKTFVYSFGRIHHDIFLYIIPFFMAFTGWGDYYSLDRRKKSVPPAQRLPRRKDGAITKNTEPKNNSWPLAFIAISLGLGYFNSGLTKILGGYLDPNSSAVLHHAYVYYIHRDTLVAPLFELNKYFWESLDYLVVISECLFLLAIFQRKLLTLFIGLAIFFHIGNTLLFDISFIGNLPGYILFLDWSAIAKFLEKIKVTVIIEKLINYWTFGLVMLLTLSGGIEALTNQTRTISFYRPPYHKTIAFTLALLLWCLSVFLSKKSFRLQGKK